MAQMTQKEIIKAYQKKGFEVSKNFVGEYTLMFNQAMNKVRVYENGQVWESDPKTGEYIKVKS